MNSHLSMEIDTITKNTPEAILTGIADKVKTRRLELNLTQKAFSRRAGIGYDSYRKFENTGDITLRNVIKCAVVLGETDGFIGLFEKRLYQSIDDLLKAQETKTRKRGSRNE